MALVLDSGPLVAALDRADAHHRACAGLLADATEELIVPGPALPEVDYLLSKTVGPSAFEGLLGEINDGVFRVEELNGSDRRRVLDLLRDYRDLDIGFVDAAVLSIVERLNEQKLATLDHRHFSVMRPRHVDALELLPG